MINNAGHRWLRECSVWSFKNILLILYYGEEDWKDKAVHNTYEVCQKKIHVKHGKQNVVDDQIYH